MNRIIIATLLALGCAAADETRIDVPQTEPVEQQPSVPVGVGEVNGLPGTPLEYSANGLPIIEGVERPDYAEDGINSWDKRWARRDEHNPTGEYRFNLDDLGPQEWIADADDQAGFRNGLEEYTWRLEHPGFVAKKGIWRSNVFHGKAFSTNSDGSINALGACWLSENTGKDCEFPNKKSYAVKDYFHTEIEGLPPCDVAPGQGGRMAMTVGNQPAFYLADAAAMWKPEVNFTVSRTGGDEISVYCNALPGSHFGGIMGRSGGFGGTTRRVTNAKDSYPGNTCFPLPTGVSFPKGLFTYNFGDISYDPVNLEQRALLCGANFSTPDTLKFASKNMFAHELGHFLGFAHFSTGIMATGTNCALFYSELRTIPQAFHQAMANFSATSGSFNFVTEGGGPACPFGATLLPAPLSNSQQFPFGRLLE